MVLAPIAGPCPTEFRQILQVELVAREPIERDNARQWLDVSERKRTAPGSRLAIGAFHP